MGLPQTLPRARRTVQGYKRKFVPARRANWIGTFTAPPDASICALIDWTAASIDGSKSAATSALNTCCVSSVSEALASTAAYPVSFSCPPRIPTVWSLSKGEPNGTNCISFRSRNSRFVVSSNRLVIWSRESGEPYREFLSFSVHARDVRGTRMGEDSVPTLEECSCSPTDEH